MNNSALLDDDALAQIGTPAARGDRPSSEHSTWVSVGPENSGLKLGYRRAGDVGEWLAAQVFEGERSEATLGLADDMNGPPDALSIGAP
jgi:hypothetical protein